MSLLEVKNLNFEYKKGQPVLENLNFSLKKGEILGILGPNGGGKSTLLKILVGLLSAPKNSLFFDNGSTSRPPILYIPQRDQGQNQVFPVSIRDVLKTAKLLKGSVSEEEMLEALKKVDLNKNLDTLTRELSGGEYQRLLLAKAWPSHAPLLILDEPTKGLDGQGQDRLLAILQEIRKEKESSIILVDHNITQVLRHCDRLLCLNRTYHWHDQTEMVSKNILETTYHCEFEHLLIHEKGRDIIQHPHHACDHPEHQPRLDHKEKK
jgi:zinc transport system ATP-binding protein